MWPRSAARGARDRGPAFLDVLATRQIFLGVAALAVLVGVFVAHAAGLLDARLVVEFLQSHPQVAPVAFVVAYTLATAALLPTAPLNLAAGFLWGTVLGTLLTVLGVSAGAVTAFLLSRYFLREWVTGVLTSPRWTWLEGSIRDRGWRAVAFTRINPIFPSGPLNWFFGVTRISLRSYLWATIVFITPPALAMSAIGSSAGSFVLTGETDAILRQALIASAAIVAIVVARSIVSRHLVKKGQ